MAEAFCISALQSALRGHGRPEIFNSDQGAPLTSQTFTAVLKAAGVRISKDGKGLAMDNIMVERRWRTVKYEEIYLREYRRVTELITALKAYFRFYNHERPHQSLGGATPAQVYRGEAALALAA
ncbi:MAG: integrase core domain-containing protein [Chromatiaceae bacterium]